MLTRIETPGAWFGERLPNGRYIIGFNNGWTRTDAGDVFYTPALIYPRINPAGLGFVGVESGEGPNKDHAMEYVGGPDFANHGPACGNSPCAYWPDGRIEVTACVPPYGSQGIRWIDTRIHPGDETIADPVNGIYQYTEHNGIKVGQGGDGIHGEDPIIIIYNGIRYLVEEGTCRVIRFNYDPATTELSISCWKMNANSNLIVALLVSDILTLPVFPLNPEEPIVPMNKRCWLTWFEFNQPPPTDPPGNSLLKIRYEDSGAIIKLDGERFATWVDGASVAEINAKIQASTLPCVVYWDGREWPEWPVLRSYDWLCVYGYCFASESPAQFEIALRGMVHNAQQRYNKVAINCQCYTSNASLTTNLKALVPVYSRVARDYPAVDMLTVFSDQARPTGLNDHPELRAYWEQLYAGITGEPMADPEMLPSEVCANLHGQRAKYGAVPTGPEIAQILNDAVYGVPDFGLSRKDAGNHVNSPERPGLGNIASDIVQRQSNSAMWDVLVGAGEQSSVNCGVSIGFQTDPTRPWVAPVQPPNPTFIGVVITDYDKVYHRNDPKGLLVYFDVTADNPVVRVELELLDDGEPSILIMFSSEERRDGRYVRALSFKPTVNGNWTLRVTATDNFGNTAFADGPIPVSVQF